jgi:hypothetical protein
MGLRNKDFLLLNRCGFTLVEIFVATSFLSIAFLSVASLSVVVGKHQQSEIEKVAVYDFKEELIVSLNNSRYWQSLVDQAGLVQHPKLQRLLNPELACVRDGTTCNEGEYDLTLFTMNGSTPSLRFDAYDARAGFNYRGELCSGFGADGTPNHACPFRFAVKWSPICEQGSTSCVNPLIKISAKLENNTEMNAQIIATDSTFNFIVVADPIPDPIVKNLFLYTNSDILQFGTSPLDIDLSQTVVYSGAITSLSFSAPALTSTGGSVSISGTTLHYEPANKYYGRDAIALSVTGPSGNVILGTLTIGVMTPHTWLGPDGGSTIGMTKDSANFCGKVVNGTCDRNSFPAWPDWHVVFNDLCLSCNAYLDSNSATFEMAATYSATVWLAEDAPNIGWARGAVWPKKNVFEIKNGRFLPLNSDSAMTVSAFNGSGGPIPAQTKAFVMSGGEFRVPQGNWWLRVIGALEITGGNFVHNNGRVEMFSSTTGNPAADPAGLNLFNAENVQFYDLSFGSISANLGANAGFDIAKSFTVKNKLGLYPQTYMWPPNADIDTLCAWDSVTNTRIAGTYSPDVIISVEGNVDVKKKGGRGSTNGCMAPQIRFTGAGEHLLTGGPLRAFDPSPTTTAAWLNNTIMTLPVPTMPFFSVADSSVSVKVLGTVGLRRGFVNESDSRIDFSGSAIVIANSDPGTVVLRPETNAGAIKNPLKDLYLATSTGGTIEMKSRQMQVDGGMFLLMNNETRIQGDVNPSQIHLHGDLVLGPGEHPKNQSLITNPVRVVIDGANVQTLHGGAQAATFGRTGYDGQMPMDLEVTKPVGSGTVTFKGLLTLLRDYVYNSGPASYAAGSAIYIPDTGSDPYVHNIGMGGYIDDTNDYMKTVSINHHIRLVSNVFFTNFSWNDLNYNSTKTAEAATTGLRIRVLEKFRISTMNQSGAFDRPIQFVGTNRFELYPIYGYGGAQGAFRPLLEVLTPNSEVVLMPEIDLGFSAWNQDGFVRALDFKGRLSVRKIWLDGQTWVCMYPSTTGTRSSLTTPTTILSGWIKPSAIMTNSQNLSPGATTLTGGSIIADSNPTYPCP